MVRARAEIFYKLELDPKCLTSWIRSRSRRKIDRLHNTGLIIVVHYRVGKSTDFQIVQTLPVPVLHNGTGNCELWKSLKPKRKK
jgi:hypothetical protein